MRYVGVELTRDGTFSDPRPYLAQLPALAAALPAGARAFATDPEHYNYYGQRCVKDLKPQRLTSGQDNSADWLELHLGHNCWKHEEDLTIRYLGVVGMTLDPAGRGPDITHLQDVILDEVLPNEHGCTHELACLSGSPTITCQDLIATWTDSACPERASGHLEP
jgi:hypothetical protein